MSELRDRVLKYFEEVDWSGPSVQESLAPSSVCFGCGPANEKGLRIRSFAKEEEDGAILLLKFKPQPHHLAFEGILNGGIIGTVLDCHCNWTAAYNLMLKRSPRQLPSTVTAEYHIKLKRITPVDRELLIWAHPVEIKGDKVRVEGEILADGKVTASCTGLFVAVKEGHPAFRRW